MNIQAKDQLYDFFFKDPTKENFRKFLKNNLGEMDDVDFKKQWIEGVHLVKTMLAMANSGGGAIVFGIAENEDGDISAVGIDRFYDKADVNNSVSKFLPPFLKYEIFNFNYDASEYKEVENKKFQILAIFDVPEKIPFFALASKEKLDKDIIYIRKGTECKKADAEDMEKIISKRMKATYKDYSDLSLEEHLEQLKTLYDSIEPEIKDPNKGKISDIDFLTGGIDWHEKQENPHYPAEGYDEFISRLIEKKKIKIEKVLDLR